MTRKREKLLALGALLTFVAILVAVSLQILDSHKWYWNAGYALSVVVVLSAATGGFLVGNRLPRAPKRRLWLVAVGGILGLAWVASGVMAVSLAFLGMNYFAFSDAPVGWGHYYGDYLAGWYHIRFLQLATLAGLLGGLSIGYGLAPEAKRDSEG